MNEEKLQAIIETMKTGSVAMPMPKTGEEKKELLRSLISMALIDGRVSGQEKQALLTFGRKVGLMDFDVEILVQQEQRRLYEFAKKIV